MISRSQTNDMLYSIFMPCLKETFKTMVKYVIFCISTIQYIVILINDHYIQARHAFSSTRTRFINVVLNTM